MLKGLDDDAKSNAESRDARPATDPLHGLSLRRR